MNQTRDTINDAVRNTTLETGKFLTFLINDETYGIDVVPRRPQLPPSNFHCRHNGRCK